MFYEIKVGNGQLQISQQGGKRSIAVVQLDVTDKKVEARLPDFVLTFCGEDLTRNVSSVLQEVYPGCQVIIRL